MIPPSLPPLKLGGSFPEKKEEPARKETPEAPAKPEYKGFLYLKCEECGKFKGFMPKSPIHKYHCDCGHVTYLKDMKVMRFKCECGKEFKYLTNAGDSTISIDCFNCGAPVDLEFHERKQEYVMMNEVQV